MGPRPSRPPTARAHDHAPGSAGGGVHAPHDAVLHGRPALDRSFSGPRRTRRRDGERVLDLAHHIDRRARERNPQEAARVVGEAMVYSIVLGTTVAVVGTLLLDHLFAAMNVEPEIAALGRRYLGTYVLGAPLFFGFFAVDAGFRASGDTRTPLAILSVSIAVTMILDPILILGL